MIENLKEKLFFYTSHLYHVDILFVFFIIFIFISILLLVVFLKDRPIIALFLIFLNIFGCMSFGYYGFKLIDSYVRKRVAEVISYKVYGENRMVIDFNITNLSKYNFTYCKIATKIHQIPDANASVFVKFKTELIPLKLKSKTLEKNLNKGQTQTQRINLDNFQTENNFTIKLDTECF